MTFATTTNHMLFVANALKGVDYQTIEAARNLGASTWTILRRIVLPMLKPTLFAVTILSFLTGLGALSAPQVLGGRDFQTITPMILTFTNSPTSRDLAALLAVILGVATILMLAVMSRLEKGGTYFSVSKVSSALQKQKITNPAANVAVHAAAYLLFAVYTLPVVLIVLFSFADGAAIQTGHLSLDSLTIENYVRVLTQPSGLRPFVISVVYSAVAAVIAVGGLLFVARILQKHKNWVTAMFEYLLHIPWILPSALLALGLIISYDHPNPLVGGAVLTGTTVILLIAFVTVKIPFTLRMLKASFASVNSSLEEAASIMGAKTLYVFRRILLPLVLPAAAAIAALNFNSMLDDYDTAIFLAHPLVQPLGLVIKANTDGAEGVDGVSNTFVYTVLLMVITGLTMYLVYGRSGGRTAAPRAQSPSRARRSRHVAATVSPGTVAPALSHLALRGPAEPSGQAENPVPERLGGFREHEPGHCRRRHAQGLAAQHAPLVVRLQRLRKRPGIEQFRKGNGVNQGFTGTTPEIGCHAVRGVSHQHGTLPRVASEGRHGPDPLGEGPLRCGRSQDAADSGGFSGKATAGEVQRRCDVDAARAQV